jgi:long-chain acyl-CoA synthetase
LEDRPWFSSYEPGVPHDLVCPEKTLPEVLSETARRFPDRPAIRFFGRDIPYRELDRRASRFANLLIARGVRPGDRVALYLPNVPAVVVGYYGILRAGAVVTLVNPLQTPRDTVHQLKDSGARFVVALDAFVPVLRELAKEAPLERVWVVRIADDLPLLKGLLYDLKSRRDRRNWVPWPQEEWFGSFRRESASMPDRDPGVPLSLDGLALLQYTGGTTGLPKGVMLTHGAILANAWQARSWITGMEDMREGRETILAVIPVFHCYGMTVGMNLAVAHGAAMVLAPKFMVRQVLKLIHDHRPSIFPGVQTMYVAINNHPDVGKYDLKSIKACISGAGALHVEVQRRFEELTGGHLVEGYGLTEASPVTHCNPLRGVRKVGCIGVPLPGTDARIMDLETGLKEMKPDEVGEIVVRGPQVMKGYWNRPEETAKVLRDGWLYTGDIGSMDADGFFRIVDRKSDMIKVAGENVYPREVEEVLFQHEAVLDCVVAGVPNETLGDIVKAYVLLREGAAATPHELLSFCKKRLAKFKWPKEVELRSELPKNMVGKALRRFLKAEELERIQRRRATGHHRVPERAAPA